MARIQREIDQRLAVSGEPVPTATAVDALQSGVERLLQLPAIDIDYSTDGIDPGPVNVTGIVLPSSRSLELHRTTTLESGPVLTEERRVVGGKVYVRTFDQAGPNVPAPWDSAPVAAEPEQDFDRAFTGGGAAGESLSDLTKLLRTAPFAATRAGGDGAVYRLRVPTARLSEYFRSQGILSPVSPKNGATTAFEFTLGPDGVLTGLSAYGTVFEDGEPLERAIVDVHYRPTAPRPITAPSPAEMRS